MGPVLQTVGPRKMMMLGHLPYLGSFPLTVTVTTMGYRSSKNPLNKAPLTTVTGRGNDPTHILVPSFRGPSQNSQSRALTLRVKVHTHVEFRV